jgi:O-antigen ligase
MGFLVAVSAAAGLIWGFAVALRGSLICACGAFLICAAVWGPLFFQFEFFGTTLSLDRILILGVLGVYLVQRKLGRTEPKDVPTSECLLLGFLAVLMMNTFLHDWRNHEPGQVPIVPHLIEGYLIPILLYWVARRSAIRQRDVNCLFGMLAMFGLYLCITAACEIGGAWALVYPRYIVDPEMGIHFGRARGPFLQSVRLGIYLLAGLAAVWIPLVWRGVWGRGGRLLGLLLASVFLVALCLTYTRSVWLGGFMAAFVLFALTLRGVARRAVLVAMVGAGCLLLFVAQEGLWSFDREFGPLETQQSTRMRAVFAYVSWLMFKDRPLLGWGFGQFPRENRPFLNDRSTSLQLESIRGYIHHNTFLSILVELGLVGFLLFVGVLAAWARRAWLLWKDSKAPTWMRGHALVFLLFLTMFAVQMLFHEMSYSPLENGLLFLFAGLMSGMCTMCGVSGRTRATFQFAQLVQRPLAAR